jgi:LmbE family N-acetylglucosaminyl deacetylase
MKIAFIFAHPDDESYGPAGTISKLSLTEEVHVFSLCNGSRPGNEWVSEERKKSFHKACKLMGAKPTIYDYSDSSLNYQNTLRTIENIIKEYCPDIVYTHNIGDIHLDHRLVSESCMVACRPKPNSNVKKLYFCELPASTDWSFSKIDSKFEPNTFVDVTNFMDLKRQCLKLYTTEIYEYPDCRSVESMETRSKFRGTQIGVNFAEAFQLVFSKD